MIQIGLKVEKLSTFVIREKRNVSVKDIGVNKPIFGLIGSSGQIQTNSLKLQRFSHIILNAICVKACQKSHIVARIAKHYSASFVLLTI